MTAALLGWWRTPYAQAPDLERRPVVFLTDCEATWEQAERFAGSLRMSLHRLPEEHLRALGGADLTARTNGYRTELALDDLRAPFKDAAAVVTCWQRPDLPLLRNLNRVLDGQDKPWVNALIDGPFLTVASFQAPHTGCFECFELRSLARLEDHVVYHDFAKVRAGRREARDTDAPMMAWLTVLAVTEGYLCAAVGSARLSGRVLGIHLPTLEIQVQDLLRMPGCPGCGRVARQRASEIHFNSRAVIDRVVTEVLQ
jgi:thiazole/oxazole-forming peptide maturase SagC family component